MIRTVRPRALGTSEVLEVVELPDPEAGPGEVVVAVRAAGVNPVDWKLYSGGFHDVDDASLDAAGLAEELPELGLECAGVVVEVGAGVTSTRVGDEVVVYPVTGAYAERVVVPVGSLLVKPPTLGWAEAGSLVLAGTTATHALQAVGVGAGDTVLVHGGAGGVGLVAVQLARLAGAAVVATTAERNHPLLRELGATPVAYGPGLEERVRRAAPSGVSAALDLVGTEEALDVSLALVAEPARIASITGSDRRVGTGVRLIGYGPGEDAGAEVRSAARVGLVEQAASGALRVLVAATFPLVDAAQAHELGRRPHLPGKIVLLT